jgi:outer membrane murein-binding lipoprotein Lpp
MSYRQPRILAAAAVAVLLLSGCASASTPAAVESEPASESAAPVEEAPEEAEITRLIVGGATLSALDEDGADEWALSYADAPATVIAQLSTLFGAEPVVTTREGDASCTAAATLATWEGFVLRYDTILLPGGQLFEVTATAPTVGGIEITTPTGVAVGAPVTELTADLPPERVGEPSDYEGASYQWVDVDVAAGAYTAPTDPAYGHPDTPEYWGAKARAKNGAVDLLVAPAHFVNFC